MTTALIGHTGFVGSHLAGQTSFDDFYNSKNIEQIAGRTYDLLVCSGARAVKWLANREPQADRDEIQRLIGCLSSVRARQVVLISTVDVYQSSLGADEQTPVVLEGLCPYGKHRFELEEFVRANFNCLVLRLPGLFGKGLKKNIVYDFLHGNQTDQIHRQSVFQFYDLQWLWSDVAMARSHGLNLVHLATEPVSVGDVAREVFNFSFINEPATPPARYDLRSRHAGLYGGSGGYLRSRDAVLEAMREFVGAEETSPLCR